MNTEQRKQKIRDGFKALGDGDAEPLMSMFDDKVQWTIIGKTKFSGTFDGLADVSERLLGPIGSRIDGHIHITVDNLIGDGDYVVCQGRGESRTTSGGSYNNTYCWVYQWSGDKIVALTEYLDTEAITASFGS